MIEQQSRVTQIAALIIEIDRLYVESEQAWQRFGHRLFVEQVCDQALKHTAQTIDARISQLSKEQLTLEELQRFAVCSNE